jgi:hypothetical protein
MGEVVIVSYAWMIRRFRLPRKLHELLLDFGVVGTVYLVGCKIPRVFLEVRMLEEL